MRAMLAVARREVQAYFVSPIAYVFMTVFLVVAGIGFYYGVRRYSMLDPAYVESAHMSLRNVLVAGRFGIVRWVLIACLLSLPGLSMRLLSEEKKGGTVELLFTSPLTTFQLVLGKFLGTVFVYALILLLTTPLVGILVWKGRPELAAVAVAYLGMFLYGATLLAIGLFASSLTESQFIALVVAYVIILPFLLVDMLFGLAGPLMDLILSGLAIGVGLDRMGTGLVDTHFLVLFLVLISTFLFLSVRVLDSARWR